MVERNPRISLAATFAAGTLFAAGACGSQVVPTPPTPTLPSAAEFSFGEEGNSAESSQTPDATASEGGSGAEYTYLSPCENLDIAPYFALGAGGSDTGEGTDDPGSESTGSGDCNYTGMDGVAVYTITEVSADQSGAEEDFDYFTNLADSPGYEMTAMDGSTDWGRSEAQIITGDSLFEAGASVWVQDGNLFLHVKTTISGGQGTSSQDLLAMVTATAEEMAAAMES